MSKSNSRKSRFIAIFMVLFGLVFTAAGGGITYFSYMFSLTAIATSGMVADVEVNWSSSSSSSSSSPTYMPTISFLDQNNTEQRAQTFLSSSSYNYPIGTKLRILYDPENPSRLRINNWFAVWGFGLIFLITGVLVMVGGLFINRFTTRANARNPKTVSITDKSLATRKAADAKKAGYSYRAPEPSEKRSPTVRRR